MNLDEKQKDKTELKVKPEVTLSEEALGEAISEEVEAISEEALVEAGSDGVTNTAQADAKAGTPAEEEPSKDHELPDFGGNYEAIELIGRGGMGAVYKVKERTSGATFAIKLLQKTLSEDSAALKRFEQEVNLASKLTHPNLVAVYGHGKTPDGAPYLVMDYLEGRSLSDVIEKDGRLEPKRALDVFIQIAEALSYAHNEGMIHRDIKPSNVILSRTVNGGDLVHLIDFGIARALPGSTRETRDLTQTADVFGSPHYMSPEQCLGFLVDERSDIYSFGCLMYESITGAPPFAGSNPIQIVVQQINESPSSFLRDLKTNKLIKQLEPVVLKCLDKEPGKRFQTIDQVRTDLQALRDGNKIPRYDNKRSKPTMTAEQLVGVFSVLFIACVNVIYLSFLTPGFFESLLRTLSFCMLAASLAGSYVFFKEGRHRLVSAFRHKETPGRWWIAIGMILIAAAMIGQTPATIRQIAFGSFVETPAWFDVLWISGVFVYALSLILLAVCAIAYLMTRTARRVGPSFVIFCIAVLSTIVLLASLRKVPDKVAFIPISMASVASTNFPDMAEQLYRFAVKLVPQNADVWEKLAEIRVRLNQVDDAIESMKKADEVWRRKQKEEKKEKEEKDKDDKDRDDEDRDEDEKESADSLVKRAELNLQVPRYEKALADIQTLRKDYPKDSRGHLLLGRWHAKQSRFDEALGEYDLADKLVPGSLTVRDRKVDVYLAMKEYEKALHELDGTIATQNGKTNARDFVRAIVLEKLGRTDDAKAGFVESRKGLSAFVDEPEGNHHTDGYQTNEVICKKFLLISAGFKQLGEDEKAARYLNYGVKEAQRELDEKQRYRGWSFGTSLRKLLADQLSLEAADSLITWPSDGEVVP